MSYIVRLYVKKIHQGEMTLEEVPVKWRAAVEAELNKEAGND